MMALALGLVGRPVQPYLTTGATDFVNSVQKGKEDAIKTDTLKTTSQKSALDLLTAQKKQAESEWVSANAPTVLQKAKKMEMSDAEYTRMLQADPEFGKLLGTEQADAVKNYTSGNLAYLNSAQDKVKALQEINQADEHYNLSMPENVRNDPNLALQHLKTRVLGAKAFDEKNTTKNEAGDVETRDSFGNVIDIKPNPNKAKAVPELDSSGKEITRPTKLGNKTIYERKMSDGTWVKLAEDAPPAPKTPLNQFGPVYFDSVMGAYVQKNLSTGAIEVKDKGYEQGDAVDGYAPRKQAMSQEKQRVQALLIPAGQAVADISNITRLSPDIKFSMAQDIVGHGGSMTSGVRNFLARSSTEADNRMYESAFKGLNNAIARLSNAGYMFSQAQANAYDEAMRFTDKDTNETKVYALLTGIQHIREALKSNKLGSKEQRDKNNEYIKELERYPLPNEFLDSVKGKRKTFGDSIPKANQPAQQPQGKQPQTAREWYLYRFEQAKTPETRKKLTDEYIKMGSPK